MKICIYEFVCGGGFLGQEEPPPASLKCEGAAMLSALATDFAALPHVEVVVFRDHRFDLELPGCRVVEVTSPATERAALAELASETDWTIVIAPEFDGHLADRCRLVGATGGRLLGPSIEFIETSSDKNLMAGTLAAAAIQTPIGRRLAPGEALPKDLSYPGVLKPRDGAGSLNVQLVPNAESALAHGQIDFNARLETFVPGTPASVAVLCGPQARTALPACEQRLSSDGRFQYLGGSLPLDDERSQRAERLALAAVGVVDGAFGYIGVDLILGANAENDVVIEINPRLTTSFVGLRAACRDNLAMAILDIARSGSPSLSFRKERLEFNASGNVWPTARGSDKVAPSGAATR